MRFGDGKAEGRAEGEARAILAVLEARGLSVSDEIVARVRSCTDLDVLETWVRRAATVDSVDRLFE